MTLAHDPASLLKVQTVHMGTCAFDPIAMGAIRFIRVLLGKAAIDDRHLCRVPMHRWGDEIQPRPRQRHGVNRTCGVVGQDIYPHKPRLPVPQPCGAKCGIARNRFGLFIGARGPTSHAQIAVKDRETAL